MRKLTTSQELLLKTMSNVIQYFTHEEYANICKYNTRHGKRRKVEWDKCAQQIKCSPV